MKIIAPPEMTDLFVLEKCISGIQNKDLAYRVNQISHNITHSGTIYKIEAKSNNLHTIPPLEISDNTIVFGNVTKKELTSLYTNYLVSKTKPGREIYDILIYRTHLLRCPFCGIGHVSTLDHFLPKNKYPSLSIIPSNLVPSCKDCNTGKGSAVYKTADSQPLHPYFDREPFHEEQWLFAEIIDDTPIRAEYKISPPVNWELKDKKRIESHFIEFNLYFRYSIEADNRLASMEFAFNSYIKNKDYNNLFDLLKENYTSCKMLSINSWETALYQALYNFYRNKFKKPEIETRLIVCPRCLGKERILGSLCDACNGVGAATDSHFKSLGDSLYEPVICECPDGMHNCRICHGSGRIDLERARNIVID
ncbi:HNH endonuclease [Raoultella planticola]|uniref:HNH endonuclease n=1 Tax=Raoultella planticola TaxID=575 RepID=UPI0011526A4B|nr:HNH endonuclease [Raoultella planticola]TQN56393.1 HNH endonuclease [Raoultella planticola]